MTQSPPCNNQNTHSETPPIEAQTTKKTQQTDSKSIKLKQKISSSQEYAFKIIQ